jgi:hypothetical protein
MTERVLPCAIVALSLAACGEQSTPQDAVDGGGVVAADVGVDGLEDTRPDTSPEAPCAVEGASFEKVHDEGHLPVNLAFAGAASPLALLDPLFDPPDVRLGEVRGDPEGVRFLAGADGLDARLNTTPYGRLDGGSSVAFTFAPLEGTAFRPRGELQVVLPGGVFVGPGETRSDALVMTLTWTRDALVMDAAFASSEPSERASPSFTLDGASLTLRVEPAGAEVVTSLSRGDEVLAEFTLDVPFVPRVGFFMSVVSEAEALPPSPILDLRAISGDGLRFYVLDLWRLDAPVLSYDGEVYAHAPNARVPLFADAGWTRAFGEPDGALVNLPFDGPSEPMRYYLLEQPGPGGQVRRSTVYSTRPRGEVLERVADMLPGAGEPTVAAEGVAFDLVDGAYVPAFPPEVCPAP